MLEVGVYSSPEEESDSVAFLEALENLILSLISGVFLEVVVDEVLETAVF